MDRLLRVNLFAARRFLGSRYSLLLVVLLTALLLLVGCTQDTEEKEEPKEPSRLDSAPQTGEASKKEQISLTYLTNPAGTSYYTVAVRQAEVIGKYTNITINVQPTPGASSMPGLVESGEAQLAATTAYSAWDAYHGVELEKSYPMLRALLAGQDTLFGILTSEATGIKTIRDLKGRKITLDYPAYIFFQKLGRLQLKAYGIGENEVKILKAESTSRAAQDLVEGRTEAYLDSLQGPKIQELASKVKVVLLPFEEDKMPIVDAELPDVVFPVITPDDLPGIPAGVPAVRSPAILWTTEDLPEEVAYSIVKTLIEHHQEVAEVSPGLFSHYSPEQAVQKLPIPYHPGAIKYYTEKGFWNAAMDAHQKEIVQAAGTQGGK
ncbi:MAG: TAXI family TRAP transporter solute-binding subunit [Clostridia bacterium]|nr:MAG: TAXI family TRAP transporter solute-binding subunit [Clostridia bacterium]